MGLGLFLSEEALQSFGGRFLAVIDPFLVWWTVLIGLGLSIVGNLDRSRGLHWGHRAGPYLDSWIRRVCLSRRGLQPQRLIWRPRSAAF